MRPTDQSQTVHVIDDDEAVRQSLRLLLRSAGLTARLYASALDFIESDGIAQPGCLVLDVRMVGMSGLELQRELNRRGNTLPIVFITGHGDVPMAVEAMQRGAFDFLQKPFRDQDLVDRVHSALQRDAELRTAARELEQRRRRFESLSPREREVLAMVIDGKPNKVIATDLGISQRTVEIHRAHAMEKMGANSLVELVRIYLQLQNATPPPGASD